MIIKVCGMREAENIRAVEYTGIQWMGFIFYPPSPRYVSERPDYMPESVQRIGVFVNDSVENIIRTVLDFGLHAVQLHGKESPEFCKELLDAFHVAGKEIMLIKAFSIGEKRELEQTVPYEPYCRYFLFDTPCLGYGGSGQSFNWNILSAYKGHTPFLLSGGLSYKQLPALKEFTHPQWAGIDLNSGFEKRPAYKDALLLQTFIQEFNKEQ